MSVFKFDRTKLTFFRQKLRRWWRKNKRDYPWRRDPSPYESIIAEVMLQKTPADRVCEAYEKFIKRFPNVHSLARAREEVILDFFEVLGLKKRGAWLKKAGGKIVTSFEGVVPTNLQDLRALRGLGDYSARAVLVFSQNKRLSLLDTNFKRLYSRFFGEEVLRSEDSLIEIVPKTNFVNYFYASLDFCAIVCTAKKPGCAECELSKMCNYKSMVLV